MHRAFDKNIATPSGFTLVELVVVIVIMGVLAAVAAKYVGPALEAGKVEDAKKEMDALALAVAGNPDLENNGTRSSFGYVGDNGALPPNLDALTTDPGLGTWRGPYLNNSFSQDPNDFKTDPWNSTYAISGVNITSSGSGSNVVRSIAGSSAELLLNSVTGNVYDVDGTPPGPDYNDSLSVLLTIPDGTGALMTKTYTPDAGGYFAFDSIPIGRHDIEIVYAGADDTLTRFVTVTPNSTAYSEYRLTSNYWRAGTSGAFLFWADFDADEDGFSYNDDTFRSTSEPSYADGARISSGGYSGGALQVDLGGINNNDIYNMSGGWSRDFTLSNFADIQLSLRYRLSQTNQYEPDEYSQVLVSIDGTLYGTPPDDYIARVVGDGSGGSAPDTDWQLFQVNLGMLSAGTHTIIVGGYNNKKTQINESTRVLIDEVSLSEN